LSNSINTNSGSLIALQALDASSRSLQKTQNEISTGLKVSSPTDNGATWTMAQNMRSQVSSWQAVSASLNRGQSIVDVAVSAAQSISDLLNQIKAKALAYSDPSNDATSLAAYKSDIQSLVGEITNLSNTSSFEGDNLLNSDFATSQLPTSGGLGSPINIPLPVPSESMGWTSQDWMPFLNDTIPGNPESIAGTLSFNFDNTDPSTTYSVYLNNPDYDKLGLYIPLLIQFKFTQQ
jgi:flagellin-like hook-associated protein FlgL